VSRATAYRLRQLARDQEKAALAFLDDRHGHPYKVTEPVKAWLSEFCTNQPQIASSRVQSELKSRFGVAVSVRETQPGAGQVRREQPRTWASPGTR
jgi:transposase